jgi:hypothetical protein
MVMAETGATVFATVVMRLEPVSPTAASPPCLSMGGVHRQRFCDIHLEKKKF